MNGVIICVQPNGERVPVEHWAWNAWRRGALDDPFLRRPLDNAVETYEPFARWLQHEITQSQVT